MINRHNEAPLHAAIERGNIEIIKDLLENENINVNAKSIYKQLLS